MNWEETSNKDFKSLRKAVGHKQMQIDFYEKFIEFASKEVGEDLKKTHNSINP